MAANDEPGSSASGRGEIEVWLADLAASGPALLEIEGDVGQPTEERVGHQTGSDVPSPERRAARVALRLVLARSAGPHWARVPFSVGRFGKPFLANAGIEFSLSHCAGMALIAVSRSGAVGVDVERTRPLNISPMRARAMAAAATALQSPGAPALEAEGPDLLQAWVRLEAYAKADGRGIGRLLTALGIMGRPVADIAAAFDRLDPDWLRCAVHDLDLGPDLFAAVALPSGCPTPYVVRRLPANSAELGRMSVSSPPM